MTIWGILFWLVVLVLLCLFLVLVHAGLLHKIEVRTDRYPLSAVRIAYKYGGGPYRNAGNVMQQVSKLAPHLKCLGMYYDDPNQVPAEKLRWAVGCIVSEGMAPPDPLLVKQLKTEGYSLHQLPRAQQAVCASFPFVNTLSILLSVSRVWPAISKYVTEKQLEAYPWLEVYSKHRDTMYIGPLDHHQDFFVPEAQSAEEQSHIKAAYH